MYKTAVIGCGRIASGFDNDSKRKHVATHIGAYLNCKHTDLVAICDLREDKLKECQARWGIEHGYTNHLELFRKEKPDIISVCTLADTHLQIIKDALRLTPVKAIFCEKPISDKARNVERVIRACERRGVILQIDHQRRFDPLHRQLRQMIMKKTYGVPQRATFYYTAGIGNTGTHMFDLLRFFFGEPKWISAVASPNPSYKDGDPNFDGMVQFESDLVVSFAACDVQNYLVFELDCFCQEARFILKSSGFDLLFFKKGPSPYFSGYSEVIPSTSPFRVKYQRSFMLNAVEHLVQCVKSGRESLSSGWDGLMALRMIEAAKLSAAQDGKKVSIFKV